MRSVAILAFIFILLSCSDNRFKLHYEHEGIIYLEASDLPELEISRDVYVPAYSDLYYESRAKKTYFTVVLSLRNISFNDTIYFDRIEYYSSKGELLREYIDRTLMLRPMESMEYIVDEGEKEGGAGANFVVSYKARTGLKNHPFIEAIMMGNLDNYRFAFSSPGIPIEK